jgi:branched-chain amino acid transport system substrate-binding protein
VMSGRFPLLRARNTCVATILVILALTASACSSGGGGSSNNSSSSGSGSVPTIQFGALLAQTGPSATTGKEFTQGITAEVNVINSTVANGKFKISPIFADNQATDTVAVSALNQLIAVNHIVASLSTYSGPSLALAPIATRDNVVLINHGGQSPQLAGASPYLFNAVPLVTDQVDALVDYAVKTYHYKRIALYYEDNATGQGIQAGFDAAVTAAGATPVGDVSFETTDTNYRSDLAKLQADKPDAVFIGNLSEDVPGAIISQAHSIGFNPTWMGYSAIIAASTTQVGGAGAEGLLADSPSNVDPTTNKPYQMEAAFDAEFRKLYHTAPTHDSDYAAEAVMILAGGVAQLIEQHKTVTGPSLQAALADASLSTNFGTIKFTSKNTVVGVPEEIQRVQDGAFTTVAVAHIS